MYKYIIRSSTYLLVAQVLTKFIAFFYTLFLARNLGVEGFGLYVLALSYFSLLSAFSEFGITRYLVREISINRIRVGLILCTVILMRLMISSVLFASFALFLYFNDLDKMRVSLTLLAVLAVLPQSIALSLDSTFIALKKVFWSALGLLILNITTTFLGVWLILNNQGVIGAVVALVLGQILYVLFLTVLPLTEGVKFIRNKRSNEKEINLNLLKEMSIGSLPYGILGVLGLVYFKIDSILLSYMKGPFEAGIYGAGYKFLEAIIFVPTTAATVLFPVMAKFHVNNVKEVEKLYWKSIKFLFSLSVLILIGYLIILPTIINSYLPQYKNAIDVLKVLSFTIPFIFVHVPAAIVLQATDKYLKSVIYLSFFTVSFNILGNLILIPYFGYMGAAYMTLLSEALSFIVFFGFLKLRVFNGKKNN